MQTYPSTYEKATSLINNMVLLNNIHTIDQFFFENNIDRLCEYNEDTEDYEPIDIYQYFITDCSEDYVEYIKKVFPSLIFAYSDILDSWILCVDHCGTIWRGVYCETTDEYFKSEEAL